MSLGVIIPALDAAEHLPELLGEIGRLQPRAQLLVVDDGSRDATARVAAAAGAAVIRHAHNRGKGAALATGFGQALAEGWEWAFTMDADGQHLPADMTRFLAARREGWDVIVGTRMADTTRMPWLRETTNRFTSWVVSRLAGCHIPDSQSGFRLFRVAVLRGLRLVTSRYDTESEVLVRLARRGCRVGAVPISTVYGEQHSAIHPLVDTGRFFRLVARLLCERRKQRG